MIIFFHNANPSLAKPNLYTMAQRTKTNRNTTNPADS